MPWVDPSLESLYLYGRALLRLLPAAPDDPLPLISESVLLTHLRTEAKAFEEDLALTHGSDEPGQALPGVGTGAMYESPVERLSVLIDALNQRFGLNLTEADKIWFEQQKQAIKEDDTLRVIALTNDRDQCRVVMERKAEDRIIERHEANAELFDAIYQKPGFREMLMTYLAESYDEIRSEGAG